MNTIESFERDVVACGAPLGEARHITRCYERALLSGSCADWIELYVGTFVTLLRGANLTQSADQRAAARLLQLLGDDLGMQLFDQEARRRLELALLRAAA